MSGNESFSEGAASKDIYHKNYGFVSLWADTCRAEPMIREFEHSNDICHYFGTVHGMVKGKI